MKSPNSAKIEEFLAPKALKWSLPSSGYMKQGAEAAGTELNSSIGVALTDGGEALTLPSLTDQTNLDKSDMLYSSCSGEDDLREKWAQIKGQTYLPLVTAGLTHGLNLTGHLFLSPGDKLHIPGPVYENYNHMFRDFFGVKIEAFPLTPDGEERLNIKAIEEILNQKEEIVKLLFNFPQNPTGYSPTNRDLEDLLPCLTKAADQGKRILIILDDAYQGLNHGDDIYPHSLFIPLKDLHENILIVKLDGATKEYYAWGLRIGFISFGKKGLTQDEYALLEDKTCSVIRATLSNISKMAQKILLKTLNSDQVDKEQSENIALIGQRYHKIKSELAANPQYAEQFTALPFNSGYFFSVQLREGLDEEVIRNSLREKYSTGVMVPAPGMIRMAYSSLAESKIGQLLDNLYQACRKED